MVFLFFYTYDLFCSPVELRDTKKKIACGQITTLDQLKVELMTLSNNALMINKSSTSVFSHATNFLSNLIEDCQVIKLIFLYNYVTIEFKFFFNFFFNRHLKIQLALMMMTKVNMKFVQLTTAVI